MKSVETAGEIVVCGICGTELDNYTCPDHGKCICQSSLDMCACAPRNQGNGRGQWTESVEATVEGVDALEPLTVVTTGEMYGVVLGQDGNEVKVRLVEIIDAGYGGQEFTAYGTGLFNRDQVAKMGFCENDYLPGLVLAAAANYNHRYGNRSVRVVD